VSIVAARAAGPQQAQAGQEEHLHDLQLHSSSLWKQAAAAAPAAADCSRQGESAPSIAGLVPDWSAIQLTSVAQLPALLKLLEASGPSEAVGQLEPASLIVQQWLGQAQVMVACLTHGIEGQGQLLRSVYDFCPRVLKVSSLLAEHRRNALLGKLLLQQSLQSIHAACSRSSRDDSASAQVSSSLPSDGRHQQRADGAADDAAISGEDSSAGEAEAAADSWDEFSDASSCGSRGLQDSFSDRSDASAAELLDSLLHSNSSALQATGTDNQAKPASGHADNSSTPPNTSCTARDALNVLAQLQHLEQWAFSQISEVVFEELSGVVAGIRLDGCLQHEAAVQQLFEQWVQGCDELVKARELGRRGLLERWVQSVSTQLTISCCHTSNVAHVCQAAADIYMCAVHLRPGGP
jgi:hypothetical protein